MARIRGYRGISSYPTFTPFLDIHLTRLGTWYVNKHTAQKGIYDKG